MAAAADGMEFTYFPGCSLATSAKENNRSLLKVFQKLGFGLVELKDWNCCGSSSTHSINSELAFRLACRDLSIAPAGRPLLVACPSCMRRDVLSVAEPVVPPWSIRSSRAPLVEAGGAASPESRNGC